MARISKYDQLVDALIKARVPKNVAKCLAYIIINGEAKSMDIERGTGLRQPEVSIAMRYLRDKGWVKKRDIKKEGKGRPVHAYSLASSVEDFIKNIEREEERRIRDIKANIDKIKRLVL
ncbi:MAG: ArsR family transcriptional regulator [Thermoplasmata archaeon]|nr:MAG: ArsR family transcriptional regulator [Thermoplasmata archaeon]